MTTDGFADWLISSENKINHLERSSATSCSKLELTDGLANDLSKHRHDVNRLMESNNENRTNVDVRFTMVVDQSGRVKAHMATMLGNAQLSNSRVHSQKVKKTKE